MHPSSLPILQNCPAEVPVTGASGAPWVPQYNGITPGVTATGTVAQTVPALHLYLQQVFSFAHVVMNFMSGRFLNFPYHIPRKLEQENRNQKDGSIQARPFERGVLKGPRPKGRACMYTL